VTDGDPGNGDDLGTDPAWSLFDRKFPAHRAQYLKQTLMATVTIMVVLLLLDLVEQTVLIASLGASTFIVFSMPHTQRSRPRYLIGGYIAGAIAGCSLSLVADELIQLGFADPRVVEVCCAALALGLGFLIMVVTATEHPPAAALALGLVLNEWDLLTLAVVMAGIVALSLIKRLVLPMLLDLI
jgi:CBS-domain-containing membrane protein